MTLSPALSIRYTISTANAYTFNFPTPHSRKCAGIDQIVEVRFGATAKFRAGLLPVQLVSIIAHNYLLIAARRSAALRRGPGGGAMGRVGWGLACSSGSFQLRMPTW